MAECMLASILLCTILLLHGARVSSVAPGDRQQTCLDTSTPTAPGHALTNAYTDMQKPLLDSYWYVRVFGGTGQVWESIAGNSNRNGVSDYDVLIRCCKY